MIRQHFLPQCQRGLAFPLAFQNHPVTLGGYALERLLDIKIHGTEKALVSALKNKLLNSKGIVSIDGVDGVGKTTLSAKIAKELCLSTIELDDFVQENKGGYVNYIDYDRLLDKIISNKFAVIEGICVLQVLNKIQIQPDVSVYIKEIDIYGFCNGQIKYFPPYQSADEVINDRKSKGFSVEYEADVIRYHYSFKPHENSDFIFQRQT
ncbi:MAG: NB-ARC domain-containing protein [Desulfurivibrionaceae bacterium]